MLLYLGLFVTSLAGIFLGRWVEARNWRDKGRLQTGRMLSAGRFFWVVDEENTNACRYLEDLLRETRQQRDMKAQMLADQARTRNVRKP